MAGSATCWLASSAPDGAFAAAAVALWWPLLLVWALLRRWMRPD